MTDHEKATAYFSRAVVELEREIAMDRHICDPASEPPPTPMRPFLQQQLDSLLERASGLGVTVDRSLASGEWAPRNG